MSDFYHEKRQMLREIVSRIRSGETPAQLADEYGLSRGRVHQMLRQTEIEERMAAEQGEFYGLSTRAKNAIENEKCQTANDVAAMTRKQIKAIPNIGKLTVQEIEGWLSERGLTFAAEVVNLHSPKTIPISIRFLERHGYTVIPPDKKMSIR